MSNILILGKGFVGTELYKHLSKNAKNHISHVSQEELNYFDEISLKKHVREMQTLLYNVYEDFIVINCSGFTGKPNVDECESKKELCLKYNTELPVFLSNFCKQNKLWLLNVSSGCIYSGYNKDYSEDDIPNFGVYSNESSFYSKTKHLSEILASNYVTTCLRIRMPFCSFNSDRNLLNKILNYDNLVSFNNSLTCIEDFCEFVEKFITIKMYRTDPGIYNVVNNGYSNAKTIVELLSKFGLINPKWNFVDIKQLNIKANRSNCILSDSKISFSGLQLPPVAESLEKCIEKLSYEIN